MAEEHGKILLRLPPHHPDFNPIEGVWKDLKDDYTTNVGSLETRKKSELLDWMRKRMDDLPAHLIQAHYQHVINVETNTIKKEGLPPIVNPIVITESDCDYDTSDDDDDEIEPDCDDDNDDDDDDEKEPDCDEDTDDDDEMEL